MNEVGGEAVLLNLKNERYYGLDEQLKLLSGAKSGDATVDKWFKGLGDYLVSTGMLKEAPKGADFITSVYMERVAADPNLKAFAEGK